jgi:hypothetical protein
VRVDVSRVEQQERLEQVARLATVILQLEHLHLLRLRVDGALGPASSGKKSVLKWPGPTYVQVTDLALEPWPFFT